MVETKLEIGSVTFVDTVYGEYLNCAKIQDVSIEYTNESTDHWNSSYTVDVPVDKKQAKDNGSTPSISRTLKEGKCNSGKPEGIIPTVAMF